MCFFLKKVFLERSFLTPANYNTRKRQKAISTALSICMILISTEWQLDADRRTELILCAEWIWDIVWGLESILIIPSSIFKPT